MSVENAPAPRGWGASATPWWVAGIAAFVSLYFLFSAPTVLAENGYTYGCPSPVKMALDPNFINVYVNGTGQEDLPVPDDSQYAALTNAPGVWRQCRASNLRFGGIGILLLLVAGGCVLWPILERRRHAALGTPRGDDAPDAKGTGTRSLDTTRSAVDTRLLREYEDPPSRREATRKEPTLLAHQWIYRLFAEADGALTLYDGDEVVTCRGVWLATRDGEPAIVIVRGDDLSDVCAGVEYSHTVTSPVTDARLQGDDCVEVSFLRQSPRRWGFADDDSRKRFLEIALSLVDQDELDRIAKFDADYEYDLRHFAADQDDDLP